MKYSLILFALLLTGCSNLPSMQYCQEVRYERKDLDIQVYAKCRAPIADTIPGV